MPQPRLPRRASAVPCTARDPPAGADVGSADSELRLRSCRRHAAVESWQEPNPILRVAQGGTGATYRTTTARVAECTEALRCFGRQAGAAVAVGVGRRNATSSLPPKSSARARSSAARFVVCQGSFSMSYNSGFGALMNLKPDARHACNGAHPSSTSELRFGVRRRLSHLVPMKSGLEIRPSKSVRCGKSQRNRQASAARRWSGRPSSTRDRPG